MSGSTETVSSTSIVTTAAVEHRLLVRPRLDRCHRRGRGTDLNGFRRGVRLERLAPLRAPSGARRIRGFTIVAKCAACVTSPGCSGGARALVDRPVKVVVPEIPGFVRVDWSSATSARREAGCYLLQSLSALCAMSLCCQDTEARRIVQLR